MPIVDQNQVGITSFKYSSADWKVQASSMNLSDVFGLICGLILNPQQSVALFSSMQRTCNS